jgi:ABC-type glycerol-3-phosphate transport system substrate-binding protein
MSSRKPDGDRASSVSRRKFVRAAGASGVAASLTGWTAPVAGDVQNQPSGTVQVAATSEEAQNKEGFVNSLREGGLPESVSIEILATSDITDDIQSQYRQWLSVGRNKPDILRMDVGWTIPFIQRGQIANLSPQLPQEILETINNDYFDAAVEAATGEDGNLYGVPYQTGLPTIQYRKDLVRQAGYNPDQNNWATEPISWQRFSEVVSEAQQQADVDHGFAWQASNYGGLSCCTFNELMTTWGGAYFGSLDNLYGPVGDRPVTVTEQPVLQALRMGRTFIRGQDDQHSLEGFQQISPQNVLQWTEGPSLSAFTDGNAVALRYWPSALPPAHEAFGEDLGVMPIPYGVTPEEAEYEGTGGTAAALGGWAMTLNPNSENQEAALEVLKAFTSDSFRQFQLETLALLPPDIAAAQQRISQVPVWGEYADTLSIAGENSIPRPVTVVWPDQSPAIAQRVNGVLAGQQAPQPAMNQLQQTLEQIEQSI